MEMSVPRLVTVSLQSYKNQIGTNVPGLSNSPGKLTDLFFFSAEGPSKAKEPDYFISRHQSSCSTLSWHLGPSVPRRSWNFSLSPCQENPAWGERMAAASKEFQAFPPLFCDLLMVLNQPSHKTDLLFSFLAPSAWGDRRKVSPALRQCCCWAGEQPKGIKAPKTKVAKGFVCHRNLHPSLCCQSNPPCSPPCPHLGTSL